MSSKAQKAFISPHKTQKTHGNNRGFLIWQGHQESNSGHAVLETAALPAELYPYMFPATYNIISYGRAGVKAFFDFIPLEIVKKQ